MQLQNSLQLQLRKTACCREIRLDTDLNKFLETYKFFLIPPSLFTTKGSLHYPNNKSVIATDLENLQQINKGRNIENSSSVNSRNVIFIDGMAIVNKIDIKQSQIRNCTQYALFFISKIDGEASKFNEVRVIFEIYELKSFKNST